MPSFKISGLEEFKVAMNNKSKRLKAELPRCVQAATDEGFKVARDKVPQATGNLRNKMQKHSSGLEGKVENDERYAAFVEFGTAKHGPEQPYIRPAQKAANKKLMEEVLKVVKKK